MLLLQRQLHSDSVRFNAFINIGVQSVEKLGYYYHPHNTRTWGGTRSMTATSNVLTARSVHLFGTTNVQYRSKGCKNPVGYGSNFLPPLAVTARS